jgi:hypothetical protein
LSALDEVLPSYRFRERHGRTIAASPDVIWSALLAITTQDLPLSSLLMGIRGLPSRISGRSNGLRRASHKPVIDQFIAGGFRKLRDDPPNVLVAGAAMHPWRLVKGEVTDVRDLAGFRAFNQPGLVLAVVSSRPRQRDLLRRDHNDRPRFPGPRSGRNTEPEVDGRGRSGCATSDRRGGS